MITFEPTADFDFRAIAPAVPGGRIDLMAGSLGVYAVEHGHRVGALAVSMADDGFGRDLLIKALAGRGSGLVDAVDAYVRAAAKAGGFDACRAFTVRPGAMLHFERLGWKEIGRYYRVTV